MSRPRALEDLLGHLEHLSQDATAEPDLKLIEHGRLLLTDELDKAYTNSIAVAALNILPAFQSDPSPLTRLIIQATSRLTFSETLSLNSASVNLVAGLQAPVPAVNDLAIHFLTKASGSPSDAAIVAGQHQVIAALVNLWLLTPSTGTADQAQTALLSLLSTDDPQENLDEDTSMVDDRSPDHATGQGLVWRRLFGDKEVYQSMFEICSLTTAGRPDQPSKSHKSIAQGRLMDLLPKVGAMRWEVISSPQFLDIERSFSSVQGGLLEFAACHMVEDDDILMVGVHFTFFEHLIRYFAAESRHRLPLLRTEPETWSSPPLDFLISKGIHSRILSHYLQPSKQESLIASYTSGPAAKYLSTYASFYSKHLQSDQALLKRIFARLSSLLSLSTADWSRGAIPHNDLLVLQNMPRSSLLEVSRQPDSPLFKIRTNPPTMDAFHALATIFRGPRQTGSPQESIETESDRLRHQEALAARELLIRYWRECPEFWANVAGATDLLAMRETAVAAVRLIEAIVLANWAVSQEGGHEGGDQEHSQEHLIQSGLRAVLESGVVIDALLRRPQIRSEDASAVVNAKYDALTVLHRQLRREKEQAREEDEGSLNRIWRIVDERVREGPWGSGPLAPRVDAMEQ